MHRHVPHASDDVAQLVVALGARELPENRAQPEIDIALHVETLGRQGERIERGQDACLGIGIERQYPALLDQRSRHRFRERPFRQTEFERRTLAFIIGLVARGENHRDVGPGPGVLGQVFGGLSDRVLGARLRQHQRKVGCIVERTCGVPVGPLARLQLE